MIFFKIVIARDTKKIIMASYNFREALARLPFANYGRESGGRVYG